MFLALVALQCVIAVPHAMAARASVTLNGKDLLPAHGSAAGVWFYTGSGSPAETQVLLTGHTAVPDSWQLTAALNAGDTVRVVLDSDAPLTNILFQSKSPWPLSETRFIASYSFDQLVGEAGPNIPNMFGRFHCSGCYGAGDDRGERDVACAAQHPLCQCRACG